MQPCRVHITGASGSGVTTLGRALAQRWSVPAHDTDDYFWEPGVPPYSTRRPIEERLHLMQRMFVPCRSWVLTGSLMGWGDPLIAHFDLVVFLYLAPEERLARLRTRETQRYGAAEIAPGGRRHSKFSAFMEWAGNYDQPDFPGRSKARHLVWLDTLPCPVMHLDSSEPVDTLIRRLEK